MSHQRVEFQVTGLAAQVSEGVPIEWMGQEFSSGPLRIELEESPDNQGVLDYGRRRAEATFHVRLVFPELAQALDEMGVAPSLSRPIPAVLHSEGEILEDHGFALSGRCRLGPHPMSDGAAAAVLPGH